MRAVALEAFGGPDRLELRELPVPGIKPDQVLVRVRAAGVGPWDVKAREGLFGEREFPYVPGFEAAGVVERIGEDVADLRVGDEVYAYRYPGGCYAEYVAVPAGRAYRKPASLTFEEAAGAPVAGVTALQGIFDELGVREGETVLITGATGGVGTFAVQIAASAKARVVGTASPRNHEHLRSLGAAAAIDYHEDDWVEAVREFAPGGVDAVFECVGGETVGRSFGAVRDGGRVAYIAPVAEEPRPPRGIQARFFSGRPDGRRLGSLAAMFDEGLLRVHIEDVLPLEEAARAHERVAAGHVRGKIVLGLERNGRGG